MRLLLPGENPLHIEQYDHALTLVHLADSGNELLVDSGPDRLWRRRNVLFRQIQHLAYGIHHQTRFYASQIHNDDARAVVGWFSLQLETLPCVQYRDHFATQVRDALNELGGLWHFGDLAETVDLLNLRNRDTEFLLAQHERDQLHFAQFLLPCAGLMYFPDFPGLLLFDCIVRGDLDIPYFLVLHQ